MDAVRRSAIAGSWYPGDPGELGADVERYLAAAEGGSQESGRLVGLLSPHAGLHYSGPVAAHAYRLLRGRQDLTAVIVGPSHRAAFRGAAVAARGGWETPLGTVPIDEDWAEALLDADEGRHWIMDEARVHRDEHCIEIQLPFMAHLVKGLRIVPVLMGSQSTAEIEALANALASVVRARPALLVASSDLSHYHPAAAANRLDAVVVDLVTRLDADGLGRLVEASHEHACGGGPMVAVMKASKASGASRSVAVHYGDSGDVEPFDKGRVVGYLAAAFMEGGT